MRNIETIDFIYFLTIAFILWIMLWYEINERECRVKDYDNYTDYRQCIER